MARILITIISVKTYITRQAVRNNDNKNAKQVNMPFRSTQKTLMEKII